MVVFCPAHPPACPPTRPPTHHPLFPPPHIIFLWRRLGRLWPALAASAAALYAVGRLAPASTTVHRFFYFEMYGGGCGGRGLTPLLLSLGFVGDFVAPDRILFYRSKMAHFSRFCLLCEQASGRKASKKMEQRNKKNRNTKMPHSRWGRVEDGRQRGTQTSLFEISEIMNDFHSA